MRWMRFAGFVGGLSLMAGAVQAQTTMILGAKVGGTYAAMQTNVTGAKPGYRSTMHGGVIVGMTIGDKFAIEGQGLYVAKGFASDTTTGVNVDLTLNYVELPLALAWTPIGRDRIVTPRIFAGPVFGFRVGCSFTATSSLPIVDCDPQNVKDFDIGILAGLGLKIGRGIGGLTIDLGYNYGFIGAAKTSSASFKNRGWMASVGYVVPII